MSQVTVIAAEIIKEANRWLNNNCHERKVGSNKDTNIVDCDDGHVSWDAMPGVDAAYCAAFVYQIVNIACANLGIDNKLYRSGSPKPLIDNSDVPQDKDFVPGAAARKKGTGSSGYHAFLIIDVDGDDVLTCEGNATSKVDESGLIPAVINEHRSLAALLKDKKLSIAHTELADDTLASQFVPNPVNVNFADGSVTADDSEDDSGEDYTGSDEAFF